MSGSIRTFKLASGDPLDRRRLTELFLEAAKRFTQCTHFYFANAQFDRTDFPLDCWEEYQSNFAEQLAFYVPKHGHQSPGSNLTVLNDDPYFEAEVWWSAECVVLGNATHRVYGWPTVDGKALWSAESWADGAQLLEYNGNDVDAEPVAGDPLTEDATISLGNSCVVQGLNGRSSMGVLFGCVGDSKITKCQIHLRKVIR